MPASTSSKISVLPGASIGREGLQREHDPRELAARGNTRQRPQVLTRIRRDEEFGGVETAIGPPGLATIDRKSHFAPRAGHRQLSQRLLERAAEALGGKTPSLGQRLGEAEIGIAGSGHRAVERRRPFRGVLECVQLASEAGGLFENLAEGSAVLALQTIEDRKTVFDFLKAGRRGVDALRVRPQEEREILELRFHAVAGIDIRTEAIIDAGELAELAPDRAEGRQCRLVTLVERRVRIGAEPLQPIRIGQHLPHRCELVVFAGAGSQAIDLLELEREELGARGLLPFARQQRGRVQP